MRVVNTCRLPPRPGAAASGLRAAATNARRTAPRTGALPDGWTTRPSKSRPGKQTYVNLYTARFSLHCHMFS